MVQCFHFNVIEYIEYIRIGTLLKKQKKLLAVFNEKLLQLQERAFRHLF